MFTLGVSTSLPRHTSSRVMIILASVLCAAAWEATKEMYIPNPFVTFWLTFKACAVILNTGNIVKILILFTDSHFSEFRRRNRYQTNATSYTKRKKRLSNPCNGKNLSSLFVARQDVMTNHPPLPIPEIDFYNSSEGGDQAQAYCVQFVDVWSKYTFLHSVLMSSQHHLLHFWWWN